MRDIDNKLLKPLAEALNGEIQPSQKLKNINKDEITKFLAIFYTLIYYNDTDHGFPKGYFCSLLDNKVSEKELDEAFEGYKFAIYYLWTKLVGPRYAVLNRLVEATNWGRFDLYFQEVQNEIVAPVEKRFKVSVSFDDFLVPTMSLSARIF